MRYSPFENVNDITELSNLCYSDMQVLSSLEESYSLEFKSEFNSGFKSDKLPKTISAFANSSGGWLIIGTDDHGVVRDIDLTDVREEEIYSIIGSRISPIPTAYVKILYKDAGKNKGVIVVYVEEGKNTPYMSNGTVYIRNGKESRPADRSTLDLLLKKGMEHSDLSLKCVNGEENEFGFYNKLATPLPRDDDFYMFMNRFDGCGRVALYIENYGKHFDENIDLTIRVPAIYKVDLLKEFLKKPNRKYEDYFEAFISLPSSPEVAEYQRSTFHLSPSPPIEIPSFPFKIKESAENIADYMKYLVDIYNQDLEVFVEGEFLYYKIHFKAINPGQKMFLPVALIFRNGITCIEYNFTSKYSMGINAGKLMKSDL